jgi:hypothetical protein
VRRGPRLAALALLVLAGAAQAQPQPAPPLPPVPPAPPEDMLFVAGGELERERTVKGAPYCAEATHETVQTLADGNRIVQRHASRFCRDAMGRTRQELAAGVGGRRSVFLRDPVAQEAWLLDLEAKRAMLLAMPGAGAEPAEAGAQAVQDKPRPWWIHVRDWGRGVRARLFGAGARPSAAAPASGASVAGMPPGAETAPLPVRVIVGGPGPMSELPPPLPPAGAGVPAAVAFQARLLAPRGAGVTTPLPPDTVEGLKAEGRRTTWTVEAGRIGNEKPIVIVHEVWTSPELGITLRSRDLDPMSGEEVYRVQNLKRGDPDPALFRVPADFRRETPLRLPERN